MNSRMNKLVCEWRESGSASPLKLRRFIEKQVSPEGHGPLWRCLIEPEKLRGISPFDYKEAKEMIECLFTYYSLDYTPDSNRKLRKVIDDLESLELDEVSKESHPAKNLVEFLLVGAEKKSSRGSDAACELSAVVRFLKSIYQILLDLDRTFCSFSIFENGFGQDKLEQLFFVLGVYSIYNPSIGYCQGMSFIAGMLVLNEDEETAFWMMASMLEREKHLSGYYSKNLSKLHHHSDVFRQILHHHIPSTAKHLDTLNVLPLMYVTQWFLSLFTCLPCWRAVLSIWDYFMLEGVVAVFQAAIAILQLCSDDLLAITETGKALLLLTNLPKDSDFWDKFISLFWSTKIPKWQLDGLLIPKTESSTSTDSKPNVVVKSRKRPREEEEDDDEELSTDGGGGATKRRKRHDESDASRPQPATGFGWLERLKRFVSTSKSSSNHQEEFELKPLRPSGVDNATSPRTPRRGQRRRRRRTSRKPSQKRLINVSLADERSPSVKQSFYEFNTPTPLRPSQTKRKDKDRLEQEDSPFEQFYYELGKIQ
ncbi:USP6 N-terminal-like protein [Oscarella lobularis]|uniref:USP6 N-terminal-like protein n=1 Tax=Oscarella lobularis TaxID=121494 RepID=UPI003313186F